MHHIANIIPVFLKRIPQSNQTPMTIEDIMGDAFYPEMLMMLAGCAHLLRAFGMVRVEMGDSPPHQWRLQACSQTAKYALMSFASYIEAGIPIIADWETRGTSDTTPESVIATGAKFLQVLEKQRLRLLADAPASRHEKVAQVIINRRSPENGEQEFLLQFDSAAGRYQLIGGRWRADDGEDLFQTAIREVREETNGALSYPDDYQLSVLLEDVTSPPTVSPTFGALTQYRFWIYHLHGLRRLIVLQPIDRWISLTQIRQGFVLDDNNRRYPIGLTDLLPHLESVAPNLLENLADSFSSAL